MDAHNTIRQHFIVGIFSLGLVAILKFLLGNSLTVAFARVSFILLFLILLIGPVMRLKKSTAPFSPSFAPWSWRGELGIWFTLIALTHFIILLTERSFSSLIHLGGSGYSLANLMGLVALFWTLLLAAASFSKVIAILGLDLWKWLHSLTHAIFYLVSGHFIYFQFFSTYGGGPSPDWFGYMAVFMAIIVIWLQLVTLVLMAKKHKEESEVKKIPKSKKI